MSFTPVPPLADVLEVVRDAAGGNLTQVMNAQLGADIILWQQVIDAATGGYLRAVGEFDARRIAVDEGLRTTDWLRDRCRLGAGAANSNVLLARRIAQDPAGPLAAAVAEGEISLAHAVVIDKALKVIPSHAREVSESILVQQARLMDPLDVRRAADRIKEQIVPEVTAAEAADAYDARTVHVSETLDGRVRIDGWLDSVGGGVVGTALRTLSMPDPGDDPRSAGQRNADALVAMCRFVLDAGELPQDGGTVPHVTLTVDVGDVEANRGFAVMDDGQLIVMESVRRLLCDSSVSRVVLAGQTEVLNVGRATRLIPAAMRRALAVRDQQRCRGRGCRKPARWCQGHHIVFWGIGGETKLDNLVLLCDRHHALVHEAGWRIVRENGEFHCVPPAYTGGAPPV